MATVYFTPDHEWIRVDGDVGVVGISDYAQSQLGDVVFVDLPEVGKQVNQGEDTAVVESVKAASEVYAPVTGAIIEVNEALAENPGTVNADAMGEGWFYKQNIDNPDELEPLMSVQDYKEFVESLAE